MIVNFVGFQNFPSGVRDCVTVCSLAGACRMLRSLLVKRMRQENGLTFG